MKHRLMMDELQVDSFATETVARAPERGTVRAHASGSITCSGSTCGVSCFILETCQATCPETCRYSCQHNTCDFTCPNACG